MNKDDLTWLVFWAVIIGLILLFVRGPSDPPCTQQWDGDAYVCE